MDDDDGDDPQETAEIVEPSANDAARLGPLGSAARGATTVNWLDDDDVLPDVVVADAVAVLDGGLAWFSSNAAA